MPNHVHGILWITDPVDVGATHASPLPVRAEWRGSSGPKPRSVAVIVGSFKSAVTRALNDDRGTPGAALWQRNYYEHIIRDRTALYHIRHAKLAADTPLAERANLLFRVMAPSAHRRGSRLGHNGMLGQDQSSH